MQGVEAPAKMRVRYEQAILHRVRALNSARSRGKVKPSSSPELHKEPVAGLAQVLALMPNPDSSGFVLVRLDKNCGFGGCGRVKKKKGGC